ncbi:MAG: Trypsin-like peptidase domain [Pseudomonadota bacterium]
MGVADSPAPLPFESIVLLSAPEHKACGSGFFEARGRIATSLHLIRSVCPDGDCSRLRVYRGVGLGQKPVPVELPNTPRVERLLPAFDLGLLDIGPTSSPLPYGSSIAPGEAVTTLGFPGCGALANRSGKITAIEPLHLVTTVEGSPGTSGSPLLNSQGQVVGIVDEAAGIVDAITGSSVSLRGSRLDRGEAITPLDAVLDFQITRLDEFVGSLAERPVSARIRGAMDFTVAMQQLVHSVERNVLAGESAPVLRRGEAHFRLSPPTLSSPQELTAERLLTQYMLYHRLSGWSGLSLSDYREALKAAGRSPDHLPLDPPFPTIADLNIPVFLALLVILIGALVLMRKVTGQRRR